MKFTVKNIFKISSITFVTAVIALIALSFATLHLPANRFTHECKPPGNIPFYSNHESVEYQQGFCQDNYHVEFKEILDRTISNWSATIAGISVVILLPTSIILLFRKL